MEQESWIQWKDARGTTYDLFTNRDYTFPVQNAIVRDVIKGPASVIGFDLLPSHPDLVDVDLSLADFVSCTILQTYLSEVHEEYDYIICDCPPHFNPVTKNSLWASDAYIIPTVPDFLSTYGIGLLQRSVHKLFAPTRQPGYQAFQGPVLGGIILTRIKSRVVLHSDYCNRVRIDYPGNVFKHMISDSVRVASAADERLPISAIPSPKGHEIELQQQFKDLAGEFISRIHHLRSNKFPLQNPQAGQTRT
jgi:chromosome partitioning protein